jgi:hypothetical protein
VGFVDIKGPSGALSDFEKTGIPFVHTKDKREERQEEEKKKNGQLLFVCSPDLCAELQIPTADPRPSS